MRQLLHDVAWGPLDYLVVDLPPGTAEIQQQLLSLISLSGAIVVVAPQDVAHLDAKRVLTMLADAQVPVLGGVENMSDLVCPHCGETVEVFPRVRASRSIWAMGVRELGRVPLDPDVAHAGEVGQPLLVGRPESAPASVFRGITREVVAALSASEGDSSQS